jgi:hypothetical protein
MIFPLLFLSSRCVIVLATKSLQHACYGWIKGFVSTTEGRDPALHASRRV